MLLNKRTEDFSLNTHNKEYGAVKLMDFYEWLIQNDYPCNNWYVENYPKDCYAFQDEVHAAYGNGGLAGIQGDYCCVVRLKGMIDTDDERDATVTLVYDGHNDEYYLEIEELVE